MTKKKTGATSEGVFSDAPVKTAGTLTVVKNGAAFLVDKETVIERFVDGAFRVSKPVAGTLTLEGVTTSAKTPESFAPPALPTENEKANAFGVRLYYVAGAGLAVLALLLLWGGHAKAATIAGIGALACPLAGRFASSGLALSIAGIALSSAGALFAAWYWMKQRESKTESA